MSGLPLCRTPRAMTCARQTRYLVVDVASGDEAEAGRIAGRLREL
ncbi:hypothetical protein [Streptomyces sp. NPDC003877]